MITLAYVQGLFYDSTIEFGRIKCNYQFMKLVKN